MDYIIILNIAYLINKRFRKKVQVNNATLSELEDMDVFNDPLPGT